jgi:hypothetical protein
MFVKEVPETVFGRRETDITNEEHAARWTDFITKRLGSFLSYLVSIRRSATVNIDSAAVNLPAVHGQCLLNSLGGREPHIPKSSRLTTVAIRLDSSRHDFTTLGKFLRQTVTIH